MRVSKRPEPSPTSQVSLTNLYGSDDSYHLLALRQDAEREYLPDVTNFRQLMPNNESVGFPDARCVV